MRLLSSLSGHVKHSFAQKLYGDPAEKGLFYSKDRIVCSLAIYTLQQIISERKKRTSRNSILITENGKR